MGVKRTYSVVRTITCRVVPQPPRQQYQQGLRGAAVTHSVITTTDPRLQEQHWLRWTGVGNNTLMRVEGVTKNAHGVSRLFRTNAVAYTQDNPEAIEVT